MTNQNPETPLENTPPAPPPNDNRRRLRELLSIPERDRTDEQWDEIIELEIQLAPGNRISGNDSPGAGGGQGVRQNRPGGGAGGAPGQQQKKNHRPRTNGNNNNRRPRQNKPSSGGGTPAA